MITLTIVTGVVLGPKSRSLNNIAATNIGVLS